MTEADFDRCLRNLVDRQQITHLSTTYMRGQDRLDAALHRSVFFDDAQINYGFFKGGPDAFVEFAQGILGGMQSSHHTIGQTDITIDGNTGLGEIYYIAFHRLIQHGKDMDLFVSGRYLDRYEKRDGVWKMTARSELIDWIRETPASEGEYMKGLANAFFGARGAKDLSNDREALR